VAEMVIALLNTHSHVYHVAPVFSVMEVECIKLIGEVFGFKEDDIDGTLNPGGSMSNMMAMLAARHEHFPHVRNKGW
jgi:glutamate/tyrosine decarboxylase-like PLP-dependent enzyme